MTTLTLPRGNHITVNNRFHVLVNYLRAGMERTSWVVWLVEVIIVFFVKLIISSQVTLRVVKYRALRWK